MKNQILMVIILCIGIVLTYSSYKVSVDLESTSCSSAALKRSNRGVMFIGMTFMISSISFFICLSRCECLIETMEVNTAIYGAFMFLLSIVLIVLGSIIHGEAKKDCSQAVHNAPTIWGMGLLMLLLSGAYLGYYGYTVYYKNETPRFGM